MKSLKILKYEDISKVKDFARDAFIIDLEECKNLERIRVLDFLAGLTILNGTLEKKTKNQFLVKVNR